MYILIFLFIGCVGSSHAMKLIKEEKASRKLEKLDEKFDEARSLSHGANYESERQMWCQERDRIALKIARVKYKRRFGKDIKSVSTTPLRAALKTPKPKITLAERLTAIAAKLPQIEEFSKGSLCMIYHSFVELDFLLLSMHLRPEQKKAFLIFISFFLNAMHSYLNQEKI